MEMLSEGVLLRGPLWPNANYVERNSKGQVMPGTDQEAHLSRTDDQVGHLQ